MARNIKGKKHKKPVRSLKAIQPDAAGIDLGSREHWVAGPPLTGQYAECATFRHNHTRAVASCRLAQRASSENRGHGEHRCILDSTI